VISLFGSMNNSVRALQTAQAALGVHSSNIAHANNPAYTRRDTMPFSTTRPIGPGILRIRDAFIDSQFRRASAGLGEAEVRRNIMTKVEDIFGDPVTGGLRQSTDGFFDAWQGLAENPSDGVSRLQVLSSGRAFAQQIDWTYTQLSAVEQTVNEQMVGQVAEVNTYLDKVFALNNRISELSRNNMSDADFRDQRDEVLDKLARLTGAMATEQPDGTVRVSIGSTMVVDGPTVAKLILTDSPTGPVPTWEGYGSYKPVFGGSGSLAGLLSVRDTEVSRLKAEIDNLGRAVATAVNDLHRTGKGLGGETGIDFFIVGQKPGNIIVNPDLQAHQIAAGDSGDPGDVNNARRLAKLVDAPLLESVIIPGQFQSPSVFYRNLIGWVGSRTQQANEMEGILSSYRRTTEEQRQAQWGVSLDEEVARLALEQKAFAAAARVITAMDDMLEHLINRTGR
jgi:flagellar hook-associated protein 1 FlgK